MSDLIERLRAAAKTEQRKGVIQDYYHDDLLIEAADLLASQAAAVEDYNNALAEIERLRRFAWGSEVEIPGNLSPDERRAYVEGAAQKAHDFITELDRASTAIELSGNSGELPVPTNTVGGKTAESYVFDFIEHGERNDRPPLAVWEQEYQDAGLIAEAQRLGYIWIDGNVACDVTVTAHGRTAAKLHRLRALYSSPDTTSVIGHVEIAHDGFAGDIIGQYVTREGKRGVVVQQDGTRVVHVYGEKWIAPHA